eukprot:TRINITY_DN10362_c0_g1_i1.p1 TRINITY_DN10362_c0_g1~~TRINITY_DN10362_c0_g1_i1.p1  ORF type:complete len:477 (+),score=46.34 TRINITY_DN10362_c0_g1_i1:143-1573(+)
MPDHQGGLITKGMTVVFGGFMFNLVLGTFHLWGSISIYVASYLRTFDPSITTDQLNIVFPFMGLALHTTMPFGIYVAEKIGTMKLGLLVIFSNSLCILLSSWSESYWGFILSYTIVPGLCKGLAYMLPCYTGWKYYPQNQGRVAGIVFCGYGLGTFGFNYLATFLVNPNNVSASLEVMQGEVRKLYFPEEVSTRVPLMLQGLAIAYLIVGGIASYLIEVPGFRAESESPESPQLNQSRNFEYQAVANAADEKDMKELEEKVNREEIRQCIRSRAFWVLFCAGACSTTFGYFIVLHYKLYGLLFINDDHFMSLIGSCMAIANACSRLSFGLLADHIPFIRLYTIIVVSLLGISLIFSTVAELGMRLCYFFIVTTTMFMESGHFVLFPTAIVQVFGAKHGHFIHGLITFNFVSAKLLVYVFGAYLLNEIGYNMLFMVFGAIQFVALLLLFFFEGNEKVQSTAGSTLRRDGRLGSEIIE